MRKNYTLAHNLKPEILFIAEQITKIHGLLVSGEELARLIDYPSKDALRKAIGEGRCTLPVTKVSGKGYQSTAYDIAEFVVNIRRNIP